MSLSTQAQVNVSLQDESVDLGQAERREHSAIQATGTRWRFGEVYVSDLQLDASENNAKIQETLTSPPRRSLIVALILEGAVQVQMENSTFVFVAGSGLVLPENQIPPFLCTKPSRVLVVNLAGPEPAGLSELITDHPTALAAAVIETHPALRFLLAVVDTVRHHPIRTEPAGAIIAKLVASLLDADQDWRTRPSNPKVSEVLTLIDKHYADTGFDTKALARQLHATPRDVQHLLNEHHDGRQAHDLLLERRLIAAMTLLHPASTLTAEQIAAQSGFLTVGLLESAIGDIYGLDTKTLLALRN